MCSSQSCLIYTGVKLGMGFDIIYGVLSSLSLILEDYMHDFLYENALYFVNSRLSEPILTVSFPF